MCLNKLIIIIAARCCVNIIQLNPYNHHTGPTLSAPFLHRRRVKVLKVMELDKSHPASEREC